MAKSYYIMLVSYSFFKILVQFRQTYLQNQVRYEDGTLHKYWNPWQEGFINPRPRVYRRAEGYCSRVCVCVCACVRVRVRVRVRVCVCAYVRPSVHPSFF